MNRKACFYNFIYAAAAVLVISLLLFNKLPVQANPSEAPSILCEERVSREVVLGQSEKKDLSVQGTYTEYQWQVLCKNTADTWVNIRGKDDPTCEISYAMLGSMLDSQGRTAVRCVVNTEGATYTSEPIIVEICWDVRVPQGKTMETVKETAAKAPKIPVKLNSTIRKAAPRAVEYVSIQIDYEYLDGAKAFEPYIANLQVGTGFHADVPSPTIVGYEPWTVYGSDDDTLTTAENIRLDYEDGELVSDVRIRVIYKPAQVDYRVRYYLQNVSDDLYTEDTRQSTMHKGETGGYPPNEVVKMPIDGFHVLYYEPEQIAADGSTEFRCYYDRRYYLLNFNLDGGYGVEPIYARFGTPFVVNTPVRPGYVFGGWDLIETDKDGVVIESGDGVADTLPATIPSENRTYKAIWKTVQTTYTVVYWRENADDSNYSYWGYEKKNAMSASYVDGAEFVAAGSHDGDVSALTDGGEYTFFTYNGALTDKHVLVEGDGSSVVNVYYTRNYYTITFKATGKCTIETGHRHSIDAGCYQLLCEMPEHSHTSECSRILSCGMPEHTAHNDSCIVCGKIVHAHGDAKCDCKLKEHTHTTGCYSNVGNKQNNTNGYPRDPVDGQIYRKSRNERYIYISGSWYRYNGSDVSSGTIISTDCGKQNHVHGDSTCVCDLEVHAHNDSCYKDVIHSHEDECYTYSCGMENHTHTTANCYRLICGITENHSHTNTCNSSSNNNTVKLVHRKYGSSLSDIWPITDDNGVCYDDGQRWKPSGSSNYKEVLVYLAVMPPEDFTLTLDTSSNDTYIMHYMTEVLPGETSGYSYTYNGTTKFFDETFGPVSANYNYITKAEDFFDIDGFTQWTSNPVFDRNNQIDINGGGDVYFYYTRNVHTLQFQNVNAVVRKEENVAYQQPLSAYKGYEPSYPSTLEPDAYYFDGWYTTASCFPGTEADFDTLTMPDGDLMLYAKWSPKVHTVRFFNHISDRDNNVPMSDGVFNIAHGNVLTGNIPTPELPGYTFVGWFYERDGEKQAFNPYDMTVMHDIDLFAEWSSSEIVNYTVNYVRQDNKEKIADTLVGKITAGQTKTFSAKTGEDLYVDYQAGWFPTTNSHSILMLVDEDNSFTFEYIQKEKVPYWVRYVNKQTGEVLHTEKHVADNKKAVVTEKFQAVIGFIPDAYYKRLVLSANDAENVITFYYIPDQTHAYYVVHHQIENADGGFEDYAVIEGIADLNDPITAEPLSITGYTYNIEVTDAYEGNKGNTVQDGGVTGTVTAEGLALYVRYTRNEYPYVVKYLEYGTDKELAAPKRGKEKFGTIIEESAIEIKDYTLVTSSPRMLEIRAVNEGDVNEIVFYYQQRQYAVRYIPVYTEEIEDNTGCGVTMAQELVYNAEALLGSSPVVSDGFEFKGWYTDLECQTPVNPAWINNDHLKPGALTGDDVNAYYALFKPLRTSLIINKSGVEKDDENQNFLFRIKGKDGLGEKIDMQVSLQGNSQVTINGLYIGDYEVTEVQEWSWRYIPVTAKQEVTLEKDTIGEISFTNSRNDKQWLGGESSNNNIFQ